MIVRTVVTTLCSGYNGTGYSSLISVEYTTSSGEIVVLNRCLANIGDGTIRFCKENKIKLSGISCIIVTSLAPHSISGFAGVFLSLSDMGSGKLNVIGPPGLKSYIDLMSPFINRKYPELNLIEIESASTELELTLDYMQLQFLPVVSTLASDRVIAIGATISPRSQGSVVIDSDAKKCIVLPLSYYFDLHLSYSSLIQWGCNGSSQEGQTSSSGHVVLFFPLAAGSYDRSEVTTAAITREGVSSSLQELCTAANVCGILISGNLSSDMCEFRYCQNTLALLNTVCKPLFPGVQLGVQGDLDSRSLSEGPTNGSVVVEPAFLRAELDYEPLPLFAGASLLRAVPLLTFSMGAGTLTRSISGNSFSRSSSFSKTCSGLGGVEVRQPLSRNKQLVERCAALKALYNSKIQPNLEAIIDGTYTGPVISESNSGKMDVEAVAGTSGESASSSSNYTAASQLRQLIRSNKRKLSNRNLSDLELPNPPADMPAFGSAAGVPPPPPPSQNLSPLQMDDFNSTAGSMSLALSLSVDTESLQHLDLNSVQPSPYNFSNSTMFSARSGYDYSETDGGGGGGDDYSYRSGGSTALNSPSDSVVSLTGLTHSLSGSTYFNSPIRSIQHQEGRKKLQRHYFDEEAFNESLSLPPPPLHHFMSGNNIPPPNPMHDLFRLSFLGTGCAVPSKHRNNSSILLSLKGTPKISLLLDVGESTAAQIYQSVCGDVARYDAILLSIRVIWISHHHADHIVGLPQLLEQIKRAHLRVADASAAAACAAKSSSNGNCSASTTSSSIISSNGGSSGVSGSNSSSSGSDDNLVSRRQSGESFLTGRVRTKYDTVTQYQKVSQYTDESKIMLIASESIMKYFEFSLCVAGLDDLVTFYPIASTLYAGCTSDVSLATGGLVTRLRSIPVHHCHSSYGVVLDFASRHKLVYSGDCRPSQSLVKAGMECDLLIHEATFDDSLASDAAKKKHSTTSEARSIAVQMKAKHTILTHFSQRYPMVPTANGATTSAVSGAGGGVSGNGNGNTGGTSVFSFPPEPPLSRSISGNSANGTTPTAVGIVSTPVANFSGISLPAMNCAVSFDFLNFSFPSQMRSLPKACEDVVKILSVVEAEKEAMRQEGGK